MELQKQKKIKLEEKHDTVGTEENMEIGSLKGLVISPESGNLETSARRSA